MDKILPFNETIIFKDYSSINDYELENILSNNPLITISNFNQKLQDQGINKLSTANVLLVKRQ